MKMSTNLPYDISKVSRLHHHDKHVLGDTGVIDEDVYGPYSLGNLSEKCRDLLRAADVRLHGDSHGTLVARTGLDFLANGICGLFVASYIFS